MVIPNGIHPRYPQEGSGRLAPAFTRLADLARHPPLAAVDTSTYNSPRVSYNTLQLTHQAREGTLHGGRDCSL